MEIDHKELLVKYIAGVIAHEGVDFINYLEWERGVPTSDEELSELRRLSEIAWGKLHNWS